jgi:hypothetical protein
MTETEMADKLDALAAAMNAFNFTNAPAQVREAAAMLRRVPTRGQRQAALEMAIAAGKDMANAEQTSHPSAATKNAQRMADFARRVLELDDHAQE